ncbi:MAG: GNAT family N-acetyltransferase [Anaerolineales bacterium]|jgi:ribosomal-protein-alanine N-acetyltransferase
MGTTSLFPVLETPRLTLRRLQIADAPQLMQVFGDDEVARWLDGPTSTDIAEVQAIIHWADEIFSQGTGLRWGIMPSFGENVIGTCGFHAWSHQNARAEIGYDLAKAWWRRGLMREALSSILVYGFTHMHLNRIEAHVLPDNAASIGLLRNLGFQMEGLLRQHAYYRDAYHDTCVFSLLRGDPAAAHLLAND